MTSLFSEPREHMLLLQLREGMKVGDFGAGSGHYTHVAAGAVGPSGRVYAIDVQEDVLTSLKRSTRAHHKSVVETVWGDIEQVGGTHLREASLDAIVLANVLFQIENHAALLQEIARVLKTEGKVLIVDWAESFEGMGPPKERVMTEAAALALFARSGFKHAKSFPAGSHHWGGIVTKA